MKLGITATGASIDAQVDPRFGRCPYFLIVDADTLEFEAVENPNVALGGGAGIQSGQLMSEKGVECVLTGNCGPNAHQTLSAAGIQTIVGCAGLVRDVIDQFKAGGLTAAGAPNVDKNFGVASGPGGAPQAPMAGGGRGMGRGQGRGMGMGGGRGMGRGMGMNPDVQAPGVPASQPGVPASQPGAPGMSREEELATLKQQARSMAEGLQEITQKIEQMEEESR